MLRRYSAQRPRVRVQAESLYAQGATCGTLTVSSNGVTGSGARPGSRTSLIGNDSERWRCREASGGPGLHSAAALVRVRRPRAHGSAHHKSISDQSAGPNMLPFAFLDITSQAHR